MKYYLSPREIPRAQAIFHCIPLLSSQYSYNIHGSVIIFWISVKIYLSHPLLLSPSLAPPRVPRKCSPLPTARCSWPGPATARSPRLLDHLSSVFWTSSPLSSGHPLLCLLDILSSVFWTTSPLSSGQPLPCRPQGPAILTFHDLGLNHLSNFQVTSPRTLALQLWKISEMSEISELFDDKTNNYHSKVVQ